MGKPLAELREQKDVVIPDGVERIGSYWFYNSDVESVTVSASVRVIGADAFYGCARLKRVEFVPESKLEQLEMGCFAGSGIESITFPTSVALID